jgi:putative addiction module killer protein
MEIREYLTAEGRSPFARWFQKLDARAAVKVAVSLNRMEQGNLSNIKSLGGIFEYKLDYGPGYRIYFGREGDVLILLLGGGTKQSQSQDVLSANRSWADYKQRRKAGRKA